MQAQMQLLQAQIKDLEAKAASNVGLYNERTARISEDAELAVQRRASAIESISDARLNRVKALAELQNIDLNQIQQLLQLADMLKNTEDSAEPAETAAATPTSAIKTKIPSVNMSPSST